MLKVTLPDFNIKKTSGSEAMKYVVHGAPVVCSRGSASSSLVVQDRGYITGLKSTGMDVDTNFSAPFGTCRITDTKCSLAVLPKWTEVDRQQNVGDESLHPLLRKSLLPCYIGGIISITDNGQQLTTSSEKLFER
jgi:hypothetical protein